MGEMMMINPCEQRFVLYKEEDEKGPYSVDSEVLSILEGKKLPYQALCKASEEEEEEEESSEEEEDEESEEEEDDESEEEEDDEILLPRKLLTKLCSCIDCLSEILELKDFEQDLKSKRKLVEEYICRQQTMKERCLLFFGCTEWTRSMFVLLLNNLKDVYKESGNAWPFEKSELVTEQWIYIQSEMREIISGWHWSDNDDNDDDDDKDDNDDKDNAVAGDDHDQGKKIHTIPFPNMISIGISYYTDTKNTELKDDATDLLKKILKIEEQHDFVKKSAEAIREPLDLSISKRFIEEQIELLKDLPVKELYWELKDLVDQIYPIKEYLETVFAFRSVILATSHAVFRIRQKFLQVHEGEGHLGQEHIPKETLELLSEQINLFKDRWEKDYAHFFTHDRSESDGIRKARRR